MFGLHWYQSVGLCVPKGRGETRMFCLVWGGGV